MEFYKDYLICDWDCKNQSNQCKLHQINIFSSECSARNNNQELVGHFYENWIFYRLLIGAQEIWPTKMEFSRPNDEIGQKMANGRLLSLAL